MEFLECKSAKDVRRYEAVWKIVEGVVYCSWMAIIAVVYMKIACGF